MSMEKSAGSRFTGSLPWGRLNREVPAAGAPELVAAGDLPGLLSFPCIAVASVPQALVRSAADRPMPSRALVSRRFGRGGWAGAPRRARMWSSSVRDRPLGSVVVGTVLVVGAFLVGQSAEHVEVPVEVDVDLAAVVADHLDLVVALFVTNLGADHAALTRVVERSVLRVLDVGPRCLLPALAAGGVRDPTSAQSQNGHGRRASHELLSVHGLSSISRVPTRSSVAPKPERGLRGGLEGY